MVKLWYVIVFWARRKKLHKIPTPNMKDIASGSFLKIVENIVEKLRSFPSLAARLRIKHENNL